MGDRGKSRSHKTRSCTQNQQSRKKKNHCIRTAGAEKGQRFNRPCTTEAHGKAQSKRGQGRLYIHRRQLRQLAALCTTYLRPAGTNSSLISRRAIVSRAACCAMCSPRDQRAERVPLHAFQAREYKRRRNTCRSLFFELQQRLRSFTQNESNSSHGTVSVSMTQIPELRSFSTSRGDPVAIMAMCCRV